MKYLMLAFLLAFSTPAKSQTTLDGLQIGTGSELSIVLLHGDEGNGGDPLSYFAFGADIARRIPEATVHMLLRPGYQDPWGRQSPGENFGRRDQYTIENAKIIAENLDRIGQDAPIVAVGHSGGAAQLALALSFGNAVVDEVILVACPCDLAMWRELNPQWPEDTIVRSVSPMDFNPSNATHVTIISGSQDSTTPSALSQNYAKHLDSLGISNKLIIVPDGDHSGNRALSTAWLTAIFAARERLAN
ncbi:alpha/beta hydrolase family protein [Marivivens niveibacter]|nr:alpha/beta fold hydrolase [Marivivens niveibacter]